LVPLLLVAVWAGQLYGTLRTLQAHLEEAQSLAASQPLALLKEEPESVEALLAGLRSDVDALQSQVAGLSRFGPALEWVPGAGPLLVDAPQWVEMADGLVETGEILWEAYTPVLESWQTGEAAPETLAPLLAYASTHIDEARLAVERVHAARAQVRPEALPQQVQEPLRKLDLLLPWLDDGLVLLEQAPDLLGMESPRTYLVLVLNDDELRPGGGFITGIGEVRLDAGRVVTMTFGDSYAVDDFSQPYPEPPLPMQRFLGVDLWVFRDSNWSPDFPMAIEQGLELYRPGHPVTVDGVVAVDQQAAVRLVDAIGPLEMDGASEPITGDTLLSYIHDSWAPEEGETLGDWWGHRKSFMGTLAEAGMAKVERGDVDWSKVGKTLLEVLEQRHMQVYLKNAPAAAVLAERKWDGGLLPVRGDFLYLVEANIGYNKVSAKIERAMTYTVDLTQSPPQAHLTLIYTHTSTVDYPCEPEVRYDPVYTQMMDRCYWAYLRLYLPEGVRLIDVSTHPIPGSAMWDGEPWDGVPVMEPAEEGHAVVGQALLLPTASRTVLEFTYALPDTVVQSEGSCGTYRMDLQKQAGISRIPAEVTLSLPQSAVLLEAEPQPDKIEAGRLFYQWVLDKDQGLVVHYCSEEGK
jgi:hypothetical protein